MKKGLKTFIFYEIGSSCRTEFLMKGKEFQSTEDAVVIGIAKGITAKNALKNLKHESPWLKNYKFDSLAARETGKVIFI
ncbi:MAG: hypothetical protein HY035_10130 [Nitrospirae bacterium]|nr:hypothetical protein [Nitrospirota bacterium]